jgi:IS30 family transposase
MSSRAATTFKKRVLEMKDGGLTDAEIAKETGRHRTTIWRITTRQTKNPKALPKAEANKFNKNFRTWIKPKNKIQSGLDRKFDKLIAEKKQELKDSQGSGGEAEIQQELDDLEDLKTLSLEDLKEMAWSARTKQEWDAFKQSYTTLQGMI